MGNIHSINDIIAKGNKSKPERIADIRAPRRRGTTDDDEGRLGNLRHSEEDEEGRSDLMHDEGLRDDRRAS